MLSNQQIQINWPKIKSLILSKWNKLSDSEVENTHGRANSLHRLVEEAYGNDMNFDHEYEKICGQFSRIHLGKKHSEMDVAEKSMDKDRDDEYLTEPNGITIPIHEINSSYEYQGVNENDVDGFNNADRHSADYSGLNENLKSTKTTKHNSAPDEIQNNQVPGVKSQDITKRRSNSSANTTSHSAHTSAGAMSRDTKKL